VVPGHERALQPLLAPLVASQRLIVRRAARTRKTANWSLS
jgi:hypothetical protein